MLARCSQMATGAWGASASFSILIAVDIKLALYRLLLLLARGRGKCFIQYRFDHMVSGFRMPECLAIPSLCESRTSLTAVHDSACSVRVAEALELPWTSLAASKMGVSENWGYLIWAPYNKDPTI